MPDLSKGKKRSPRNNQRKGSELMERSPRKGKADTQVSLTPT